MPHLGGLWAWNFITRLLPDTMASHDCRCPPCYVGRNIGTSMTSSWRKDMFIIGGPFEKRDGMEYLAEKPFPLKFGDASDNWNVDSKDEDTFNIKKVFKIVYDQGHLTVLRACSVEALIARGLMQCPVKIISDSATDSKLMEQVRFDAATGRPD